MRSHIAWLSAAIVSIFLLSVGGSLADPLVAPSSWVNERGSRLNIWSVNGDVIQGEFINNAAGFDCQGIPYPASGKVTAAGLYFVVTFAKCNSFTQWRGRVRGVEMPTQWTLYYIGSNGSPGQLRGKDTFKKVN